ncbi:protein bimA [Physcia stellaris]|nr:protein bimA [Physcia stellaris]
MPPLYTIKPVHVAIFEEIMRWGNEGKGKINWAWKSSGGWEGWAQVELHFLFPERPEKKVGSGLLDIKSNSIQESVIVELKCEGAKNRANFKAGVEQDLVKMQSDFEDEWWKLGSCTVYSIALSMSNAGDRDLRDLGMGKFTSSEGHDPPFRLWWASRFIAADHLSNSNLTDEQKKLFTERDRQDPESAPFDYEPDSPVAKPEAIPEAFNHYEEANHEAPNDLSHD